MSKNDTFYGLMELIDDIKFITDDISDLKDYAIDSIVKEIEWTEDKLKGLLKNIKEAANRHLDEIEKKDSYIIELEMEIDRLRTEIDIHLG